MRPIGLSKPTPGEKIRYAIQQTSSKLGWKHEEILEGSNYDVKILTGKNLGNFFPEGLEFQINPHSNYAALYTYGTLGGKNMEIFKKTLLSSLDQQKH